MSAERFHLRRVENEFDCGVTSRSEGSCEEDWALQPLPLKEQECREAQQGAKELVLKEMNLQIMQGLWRSRGRGRACKG